MPQCGRSAGVFLLRKVKMGPTPGTQRTSQQGEGEMRGRLGLIGGIILGLWANSPATAEDPRAMQAIKALGGEVRGTGGIMEVSLIQTPAKDADLKTLHLLPELEVLGLDHTAVT